MTDIVEQINDRLEAIMDSNNLSVFRAAAAEITTLRKELAEARAENERLRVVLEPFAARAGKLDGIWKDHETQWSPAYGDTAITVGHLRAAFAAIRPPSKSKGEKK